MCIPVGDKHSHSSCDGVERFHIVIVKGKVIDLQSLTERGNNVTHFEIVDKIRTSKFCRSLSGFVLLGMTQMFRWTSCRSKIWAGVLWYFWASCLTTGSSSGGTSPSGHVPSGRAALRPGDPIGAYAVKLMFNFLQKSCNSCCGKWMCASTCKHLINVARKKLLYRSHLTMCVLYALNDEHAKVQQSNKCGFRLVY